jgi:iron complex outermembrane receptor protein
VAPGTYLRLAASRSLSRARQQDLRVSTELSGNAGNAIGTISVNGATTPFYYSGTGGNPALKPYLSDNLDIAAEKYFARGQGLIQLNGFYKNLTNFVNPTSLALYTADASVKSAILSPGQIATTTNSYFVLGTSGNTGKGYVRGAELNAVLPLSVVAPQLGFGVMFNGAYTDSSVNFSGSSAATTLTGLTYVGTLTGGAGKITVPGLSKWVLTGTVYFERNGFSARAAYTYRDTFLCETSTVTQAASLSQCAATNDLSGQIGYEFKEGPMQGLSLYLQGKNLTDNPFKTFANNDPRQVINYEKVWPLVPAGRDDEVLSRILAY